MADKKYEIVEIKDLIKQFVSLLDEIYRREIVRFNWRDFMFNRSGIGASANPQDSTNRKGLLYSYHRKFIAFARTIQLFQILAQSLDRFNEEKDRTAQGIQAFDLELSKRIRYFSGPLRFELEWLEPIRAILNTDVNNGIGYIKSHFQEIMQKLNLFSDKRTAYELRRIILLLSGEEIAELNKCINDVGRWFSYRITNRIEFFTQRLALYLRGGKANGDIFLGLASNFKDADLARHMMNNPQIKKLWTYKQEIQFFNWAREIVLKSLREEGRWEGFYEFYNNLRRGKNYIKMVKEKFGNLEFASFLERLHEKIHEAPEIWERDLAELSQRLNDSTYQNRNVIEPARQALIAIFNVRIQNLLVERTGAVNKLQDLLNAIFEELENAKTTTQQRFGKMLKKYRRKLVRDWEKEKREYESREDNALFPLVSFRKRCETVLNSIDRKNRYAKYKMVLNYSVKGDLFLPKSIKMISEKEGDELLHERMEGPILYALYKRHELAKAKSESIEDIETIEATDVEELKSLINIGRKIILPNLNKLLIYIYSKVDQYCIHEVQNLLKQYTTETGQLRAA